MTLTLATFVLLWLGAFIGGVAAGAAGFAFALVASAIWLHAIDPLHSALLVVGCGAFMQSTLVWQVRRSIEPGRLWPFVVGGLIGVPFGVELLAEANPNGIKGLLGLFLAAYGIYVLATPKLPRIDSGGRRADGLVGLAGGLLSGIGGYSGVLPVIWTQVRGWPKEVARGTYQPFILAMHLATLICVGFVALDRAGLILLAAALPALFAGVWVGWNIYGRLDERRFQQVLAALLLASGLTLVF